MTDWIDKEAIRQNELAKSKNLLDQLTGKIRDITNNISVGSFRDLMNNNSHAEIRCQRYGVVVRRLSVMEDMVHIDPMVGPATIGRLIIKTHLDTPITYEPWFLDRGNLCFSHPDFPGGAKICTELDTIQYGDSDLYTIYPVSKEEITYEQE
jgi:hypothetical protein